MGRKCCGITWRWPTVKKESIPKLYTLLKWLCVVLIAIITALVGFGQSLFVSYIYDKRSNYIYSLQRQGEHFWQFVQYVGFNLCLSFLCSFLLWLISPAASGSGIPDVKAFLNGVESPIWKNFFTVRTFVAKVVCSALAVSASLVMGKEGPMLHAGSIVAVILGSNKWLKQQMEVAAHWGTYTYNKELRDLVSVGVACGVTTAFKAPVGGVLFAMEISTRWRQELTWRCFLAAAITVVVVRECLNICKLYTPGNSGLSVDQQQCFFLKWGSLVAFNVQFPTPYLQVWRVCVWGGGLKPQFLKACSSPPPIPYLQVWAHVGGRPKTNPS